MSSYVYDLLLVAVVAVARYITSDLPQSVSSVVESSIDFHSVRSVVIFPHFCGGSSIRSFCDGRLGKSIGLVRLALYNPKH